jgi:hypothetical protein
LKGLASWLPKGLVFLGMIVAASCGAEPATQPGTTAPSTPAAVSPSPTLASQPSPTIAPTPTAASGARAEVSFEWASGGVRPADADDVQAINAKLITNHGILGSTGNETRMIVVYDPTLITVEQIQEIFRQIGHPVVVSR